VKILSIETSTDISSVSLAGTDGMITTDLLDKGAMHAEFLIPAIERLCGESSISPRELNLIVCDIGPGLFTGLRVGLATAKSLAQGLGVPIVGVSSLDVLANQALDFSSLAICALDARRGEVFVSSYSSPTRSAGLSHSIGPLVLGAEELTDFVVDALSNLVTNLTSQGPGLDSISDRLVVNLIGNGFGRYWESIGNTILDIANSISEMVLLKYQRQAIPRSETLISMGRNRFQIGQAESYDKLLPIYVRSFDAKVGWKQRNTEIFVVDGQ
jgi:tRNA threonylcarbamoyladenosine biosynthesis protein TsaB